MTSLRGGLMVCGTTSDAGKSTIVAGLCRVLARRGVAVAPFKAQNMALNSAVTPSGHEIGRAQAAQAEAAGIEADVAMNPILLKPTSDRASQVVVLGRPWDVLDAAAYQQAKAELWEIVLAQLDDLRRRFDVVICEGAGSPAEINLFAGDIVNLRLADGAGLPALLVGDIDRGGVFAALYGTVALLPPEWQARVQGFVINKFRGDPALLRDGPAELERRTGIPTLGVVPWVAGVPIDAEDSLALRSFAADQPTTEASAGAALDVAVIQLPRLANFTDVDPLVLEPGVRVRMVRGAFDLGTPDLLVLLGSKATISDLEWLRATGLAARHRGRGGRPGRPHHGARGVRRLPDAGPDGRRSGRSRMDRAPAGGRARHPADRHRVRPGQGHLPSGRDRPRTSDPRVRDPPRAHRSVPPVADPRRTAGGQPGP